MIAEELWKLYDSYEWDKIKAETEMVVFASPFFHLFACALALICQDNQIGKVFARIAHSSKGHWGREEKGHWSIDSWTDREERKSGKTDEA